MRRSRRLFRAAASVALAAMFFAQAAFAVAACEPARASSLAEMVAAHAADEASCHEPAENANLCLTHLQARDQTLDKHQVNVPDVSGHVLLSVSPRPEPWKASPVARRAPAPTADPPPRILFRTLLI